MSAPDDMSVEFHHCTKEPLTTLDIENTINMDRDEMRHMKGGQIGRLALGHRTTHAADKEMLEVLPEDITASQCSVPLGMFDSRKCEFSFGEKFLDSSMEDSVALPVFTPMNFWRCAYKNEALVQCNQNFSCLDSLCVCEGSVFRACDSDQSWLVLEVSPHDILALGGTEDLDLLRHFEIDGAQWTQLNIGDWQDWSAIAVSGVHRAFVRREYLLKPEHLSSALHGVIYDLGYAPFQKLLEFSAERVFPNCGAWQFGKLVTDGHTLRRMQTAELERPPRVARDLGLATLDRAADGGGIQKSRCRSASPRFSGIAAADAILDADEAEAAMEEAVNRRVAKTKSVAREAKRKSTNTFTFQEARDLIPAVKGCSLCVASSGIAWQIRYLSKREPPRLRQVIWLGERKFTSEEALFECLRCAWDEDENKGLGSCPFDFSNT